MYVVAKTESLSIKKNWFQLYNLYMSPPGVIYTVLSIIGIGNALEYSFKMRWSLTSQSCVSTYANISLIA